MRIPPLYKEKEWQLFMGGVVIGGLLAWGIFLYMYGSFQDKQLRILIQQQETIQQLETEKNVLIEDKQKLNEETKDKLVVQDIQVKITNAKEAQLDALLQEQLTNAILDDLQDLLTDHVETVSNNKEMLKKLIENKEYKVDSKVYQFHVETIYFDTTLEIYVRIVEK